MTNTTRDSIKKMVQELKQEKTKLYYCIELTFDAIKYKEHFKDYDGFWNILTLNLFGPEEYKNSNNEWFYDLQPEGFYFKTESFNLVQYRIYLETKKKIDFKELQTRVEDIVPALEIEYYMNDEYQFHKMFANDIFKIYKSDIKYIGKVDNIEDEDEELPF